MLKKNKLYFIIYLLQISICYALSNDDKQAIEINANHAKFDQKNKTYTFNGNILIKRGSINIYADKGIATQINESHKQIKLFGSPIRFFQQQDNKDIITGVCNRFFYDSATGDAILMDNAKISKGKINVQGNLIKYNTKNEVYSVEGNKSNNINNKFNERVTIILDDVDNATKSIK